MPLTKLTNAEIQRLPHQLIITGQWETKTIGYRHTWESIGTIIPPAPSIAVHNHSPDGFSWGFGGSGPSQLALAIMLEFLPKEIACAHYMQFKWDHVSTWARADIKISIDLCAFAVKYKL